jgi:hypothetical protein
MGTKNAKNLKLVSKFEEILIPNNDMIKKVIVLRQEVEEYIKEVLL